MAVVEKTKQYKFYIKYRLAQQVLANLAIVHAPYPILIQQLQRKTLLILERLLRAYKNIQ